MRPLSASSLETYRRCPQQWKLKYVDGLEEEDKPFFNLGRAVHAALETFYRKQVAAPAPREEVLEAFHEEFDPEAYESEAEAARRRADGVTMVEDDYEEHAENFEPALAVEKRLAFEVERHPEERVEAVRRKVREAARGTGEAAALADRYGALKAERDVVEEELEEVESKLTAFFEATGERAVAGEGYRVTASRREEWRIDDDEALRELLEPRGLWGRFATERVAWCKKKALPEDEDLPEEVREACREIGYRKTIWRLTPSAVSGDGQDGRDAGEEA